MIKKTIKDVNLQNKALLVRVDYNVSFSEKDGQQLIADDTRIRQSLPTLDYLISQQPKRIVLMSHLGEPKDKDDLKFSLKPVAQRLSDLLHRQIRLISDYTTKSIQTEINNLVGGEIVILENVRFYKQEQLNSRGFAQDLSQLGEIFINDAFGSSHRAHASVVGVSEFLPAIAGLLMEKEVRIISEALEKPEHPFVVILGGAKATTKIPMIERLMTKADFMLLGGGVANTFLKAFGYHIGHSVYSPESLETARSLIWKATRVNTRLFLPNDVVVGSFASKRKMAEVKIDKIPAQFQALDVGQQTISEFSQIICQAKTVIWNGPMGANEIPAFKAGTEAIYNAIVANKQATSIVGGGDTLTSINGHDHLSNITHISTGGGAMLEFIEKGTLPGVEVLEDK